jgi:hypothetical protein
VAPIEPVVRPVGLSLGARASDPGDAKPCFDAGCEPQLRSGSRSHNSIASANCSSSNSIARTPASTAPAIPSGSDLAVLRLGAAGSSVSPEG